MDALPRDDIGVASRAILERAARRTHRFDFAVWFWGDAIAFDGLLDAAELLPDDARHHRGRLCDEVSPPWRETAAGHAIRCQIPLEDLLAEGLIAAPNEEHSEAANASRPEVT